MKRSSIGIRQDRPSNRRIFSPDGNTETRSIPDDGGRGSARDESRNVSSPFQRPDELRSRSSPRQGDTRSEPVMRKEGGMPLAKSGDGREHCCSRHTQCARTASLQSARSEQSILGDDSLPTLGQAWLRE